MRFPIWVRIIAGVVGAAADIWAMILVIQGRFGLSVAVGVIGTLCLGITFAAMRESAY
jgi:hypothetical protein